MAKYEKKPFRDTTVTLDGNEYIDCRFKKCQIIYGGGTLPKLLGNRFEDCVYSFDGAAARTVEFMAGLYSGGAAALIEATFDRIRGKSVSGIRLN